MSRFLKQLIFIIFASVHIAFMKKQTSRDPYSAIPEMLLNVNLSLYTYSYTKI